MIRNIVFDLDGTIADSFIKMVQIVNDLSSKYGYGKLNKDKITFLKSKGARWLISNLEIPIHKIPFLEKSIREEISKSVKDLKPISGIPLVLEKLRLGGITLGILTSNSKENVQIFLKRNDIDIFNFIYHGSSLFGKDKLITKMLAEQKIDKNETIYVGDEDRDIQAAKKAGVRSLGVTWGFNSKELIASQNPDFIAHKPQDILKVLKGR